MTTALLPVHIIAAVVALACGYVSLFATKGAPLHRKAGMLFVYAMVVMGVTASILEFLKGSAASGVIAPLITLYLVGTALTTVRPESRWTRAINIAALACAVGLAIVLIVGGLNAVSTPGLSGGVPFRMIGVMSLFLAAVLLLAAIGDARVMRNGMPKGRARLARHLWRMCFALFIAAGSFFSIRERVATILPFPFTSGPMRALPIELLFGAMFYWLWRMRTRRKLSVVVQQGAAV